MDALRLLPVYVMPVSDGALLKRGLSELLVKGPRALEAVSTIIDAFQSGMATKKTIVDRFAGIDRPCVEELLDALIKRRFIVCEEYKQDPCTERECSRDVFYWHFGSTAGVPKALIDLSVGVIGINHVSLELARGLMLCGIKNTQLIDHPLLRNLDFFLDDEEMPTIDLQNRTAPVAIIGYEKWEKEVSRWPDLIVATSDFGGLQLMSRFNEFCVRNAREFLPIVLQDMIGYLGPWVVPHETSCFECLRLRQNANLQDPALRRSAEYYASESQSVASYLVPMACSLANLASIEIVKRYLHNPSIWNIGSLIEVNFIQSRMESRRVLKAPRCAVCSPLQKYSSVNPYEESFGRSKESTR
jgi:molybdopterin-synthase adenylyltransferase